MNNSTFIPNYTVPGFSTEAEYTAWCEGANDLFDAGICLHESLPQAELAVELARADLFLGIQRGILAGLLSAPFFVTDSFAN